MATKFCQKFLYCDSTLIGKSNLQDWGHLGKYWGPVLPNWHSLIPRETLGRNSFEAFNSHKEASLPSEARLPNTYHVLKFSFYRKLLTISSLPIQWSSCEVWQHCTKSQLLKCFTEIIFGQAETLQLYFFVLDHLNSFAILLGVVIRDLNSNFPPLFSNLSYQVII